MTRSFLNKSVGRKGKFLLGTALVALTSMLLFMVCGGDDDNPPGGCPTGQIMNTLHNVCMACTPSIPGCPGYVAECPAGQILSGGVCTACPVTQPGCPGYTPPPGACDNNPGTLNSGCPGDPCIASGTTTPGCVAYNPCAGQTQAQPGSACCQAQPTFNGCVVNNPCAGQTQAQPGSPCCQAQPTFNGCVVNNPCAGMTTASPGTPCCQAQPTFNGCQNVQPCAPGDAICCMNNPSDPNCGQNTNHCAGLTQAEPGSLCCAAQPFFNGCVANPCAGQTQAQPGSPCCTAQPTFNGCSGGTSTGTFCRWNGDPTECYEIGGPWSDEATATEASCRANYGEVVTNCNAVSSVQWCRWPTGCFAIANPNDQDPQNPGMTNLQACQAHGHLFNDKATCDNFIPPAQNDWCRWETGCFPISNPTAMDPENPGMTNRQVCEAYGAYFTTEAACNAYTPPAANDWCYWDGTGCSQIRNPTDIDPQNPGMTNRQVCQSYGLGYFTSQAACLAFTPPAVIYYCDWGTGGCWNMGAGTQACDGGGSPCTGTQMDHCRANGAVVQCTGTDRPSTGTCCVGTR